MLIQNLHVVVNLEFLLVLSNVFMSALPTDESASAAIPSIQQTSQAIIKELPVTIKPADEEPLNVDVQINIRDPEIALLADAKDKETNALFMKVSYLQNGTPRCSSGRNVINTGPEGNSEFCFPRISVFPETKSRETLRFEGNTIHCFPRDQSLSDLL